MKLISLVPEVGGFYKLNWNTIVAIRATCGSLILSFPAEMEDRLVFSIASRDATLINSDTPPFGNRVADAFPLAAEDIVEAAMCLGLSRFTASAFHLMRALEGSLQQLGKHLSLASVDIEWGKLISAITTAVETMPKGEDRNRWSENLSLLYHVKQAWRNDTMHPKKTYTEEEAHGLFQATKSFMHHLALLVSS